MMISYVLCITGFFFRTDNPIFSKKDFRNFFDRSYIYLLSTKDKKYSTHVLDWDYRNRINADDSQVLDFLVAGKLMSSIFQDEIAYQCFYLAHLKDYDNIGANSKMPTKENLI